MLQLVVALLLAWCAIGCSGFVLRLAATKMASTAIGCSGFALRHAATKLASSTRLFSSVDGPIRSAEWARRRGMEPGYGGIWPGNPDAKKYKVTVRSKKTGEEYTAMVPSDRYIYFYFEEQGIDLPVINQARMCRQGCCTICTAKVSVASPADFLPT